MAQTSYTGIMVAPSGHRLVIQSGTHAWTLKTTKCTLTVHFHRLVGAIVKQGQGLGAVKATAKLGIIPYVSTTMYTFLPYEAVVVSRKTLGGASGAKFTYTFIGY